MWEILLVLFIMLLGWYFVESIIWLFKNIKIKIRKDENTK